MWHSVMNSFEKQNHYTFLLFQALLQYTNNCVHMFPGVKSMVSIKNEITNSSVLYCLAVVLPAYSQLHLPALTSPSCGFTLESMLCILSTLFNFAALLLMCCVSCFPSELEAL